MRVWALVAVGTLLLTPVAGADAPPAYLLQWGSYGSADGQFNLPCMAAIDAAGDVYVVDGDNHRIQVFTDQGTFLRKWGTQGNGPGQFGAPTGIAIDDNGDVYVGDTGNHRVQKFTAAGDFILMWGSYGTGDGEFINPTGVGIDAAGDVIVTDYKGQRVQKFTSDGTFLTRWGSFGVSPGEFNDPYGVGVDGGDHIYIADKSNHRVQKFDDDGGYILSWGSGPGPGGSAPGQFREPQNVAWDYAGAVYVPDKLNNRVQKFSLDGDFLAEWGTFGAGPGEFNQPEGLAVDRTGTIIYIVDWQNHRVQKFGYPNVGTSPPASRVPMLVIDGTRPNPSAGRVVVRFGLPQKGSAALDLFDLAGRALFHRELGELGPGSHEVELGGSPPLPVGMHVVRLTQGGRVATARIAVVR